MTRYPHGGFLILVARVVDEYGTLSDDAFNPTPWHFRRGGFASRDDGKSFWIPMSCPC